MPLPKGTSNAAREKAVKIEIAAGRKPSQAVAIAYSNQRRRRAARAAEKKGK